MRSQRMGSYAPPTTWFSGSGPRLSIDLDGITVPVLCLAHLIANKRASGRDQDLLDLKWIERNDKIGD